MIYISGPISNIPNDNRRAFGRAVNYLTKVEGYDVSEIINPFDIDESIPQPHNYITILKEDLKILIEKCDTIYMLYGWENSNGANVEFMVAKALKYRILYEGVSNETG